MKWVGPFGMTLKSVVARGGEVAEEEGEKVEEEGEEEEKGKEVEEAAEAEVVVKEEVVDVGGTRISIAIIIKEVDRVVLLKKSL